MSTFLSGDFSLGERVANFYATCRDQELTQAARYQKGARNKACCLLLILAIILTVVLLAVCSPSVYPFRCITSELTND